MSSRSTSCGSTATRTPRSRPAKTTAPDGKQATVTYQAEPGPLSHFGPVEIAQNTSVGDRVIRRQLTYKPGDLYRRSVVQNSQRRLYGMELFQFVNIESLEPDKQEPEVRTRVTVAEGKHQRVNFGVGYGTEENGRVDGEYHHVNFLGGARSAGVHARYSSLDRGIRVDFNQPYLFNPRLSFGADGQQWWTYTPAYQLAWSRAAKPRSRIAPVPRLSWSVSLTSERNSSEISEEALNDPSLRDELIALGLDPETGQAGRHDELARLRLSAFDGRQCAQRAQGLSAQSSMSRKRADPSWHVQLLRGVGRCPALSADQRASRHRQSGSDRRSRAGGRHPGQRAVPQEVLSGRGDQHPRLGTLRDQPAQRGGLPVGRQQPVRLQLGGARRPHRQCRGRRLS